MVIRTKAGRQACQPDYFSVSSLKIIWTLLLFCAQKVKNQASFSLIRFRPARARGIVEIGRFHFSEKLRNLVNKRTSSVMSSQSALSTLLVATPPFARIIPHESLSWLPIATISHLSWSRFMFRAVSKVAITITDITASLIGTIFTACLLSWKIVLHKKYYCY